MGKRRRYSDADKATALELLRANGGNLSRTSRETGVPVSTLHEWKKGEHLSETVPELRKEKRGTLASQLEAIAWKILDVLPDKLEDASARELATTLGIVIDKAQLLRGQPTEHTMVSSSVAGELDKLGVQPDEVMQAFVEAAKWTN